MAAYFFQSSTTMPFSDFCLRLQELTWLDQVHRNQELFHWLCSSGTLTHLQKSPLPSQNDSVHIHRPGSHSKEGIMRGCGSLWVILEFCMPQKYSLETKLRWAIRKHFFPFGMFFYIWNGFVCWKLTSSSTWSPSRGVGWSFWKVAWLPWLIHGSGTRTTSVQISQRVGEALVQSSIKIWQQLKCPPMKGVVCYYGPSVLCPPKLTCWRLNVQSDGIWRWRLRVHHERAILV